MFVASLSYVDGESATGTAGKDSHSGYHCNTIEYTFKGATGAGFLLWGGRSRRPFCAARSGCAPSATRHHPH